MTSNRLLACGIIAGPLFLGVSVIQGITHEGFGLTRHPLSLLSLGDLGWIQIANFVVSGLLYVAFAVGLRRALHPGRAGTWAPVLAGLTGIGLITAGVFVTDPGAGFPEGAPAGASEQYSWHAIVHEIGFLLALSWLVACFVLLRRFAATRERGWAVACVAAPIGYLVVAGWPDLESFTVRLLVASAIELGFFAALAVRFIARPP